MGIKTMPVSMLIGNENGEPSGSIFHQVSSAHREGHIRPIRQRGDSHNQVERRLRQAGKRLVPRSQGEVWLLGTIDRHHVGQPTGLVDTRGSISELN